MTDSTPTKTRDPWLGYPAEYERLQEQLGNGYVCVHGHRWYMVEQPTRCPGCGTSTFEAAQ